MYSICLGGRNGTLPERVVEMPLSVSLADNEMLQVAVSHNIVMPAIAFFFDQKAKVLIDPRP